MTINLHLGIFSSLTLNEGCFNVFENKNNPNRSLVILEIRI